MGHSRPQVVRAVFGADFPPEFFVVMGAIAADWDALDVDVMCRAREVYGLAEPDHEPHLEDDWNQRREANAAAQHPDVVLLLDLSNDDAVHGRYVVGYDVRELRAGRSTVVGFPDEDLEGIPARGASYTVLGPSLLHVLDEWATDHLRMMRFQATKWENIRYGMLGDAVERAEATVRRVEDMRRQSDALPWSPTDG